MIKFRGSGDLRALAWKISTSVEALERASDEMAEEATNLIAEGWRDQADPYGKAWKARARETKRSRGKQILVDSGNLKASWHKKNVSRRGFTVASGARYSSYHQDGRGVAKRMIVPSKRGIPESWTKEFKSILWDAYFDYFR